MAASEKQVVIEVVVPFASYIHGHLIAPTPGDRVTVPKSRADALVAAGFASYVREPMTPPENKSEGVQAPEVKRATRRKAADPSE